MAQSLVQSERSGPSTGFHWPIPPEAGVEEQFQWARPCAPDGHATETRLPRGDRGQFTPRTTDVRHHSAPPGRRLRVIG